MASILNDRRPPTSGQRHIIPYIAAGAIGLASVGLMGRPWQPPAAAPAKSLQQAISSFDAGHLTPAAAAFKTMADAGNPHAAYWYGHTLDRGLGIPPDPKAAIAQYTKASAGGVVQATTRLGELYLDGNVVPPDFAKARTYLTAAANAGDARAALDLGRVLQQGIGGPADPVAAYAWLEVAALRGSAPARVERDRLLATLTPAEQVAGSQQASALQRATAEPARAQPSQPATPVPKAS
jgi:TPR repeat protein